MRPNAPINVIVGALILKEFNGLADDEMIEEMECDFRYQYAPHTMSYDCQPISERTFSRFRERVAAYELTTGVDLIHECVTKLAEELREFMEIEPKAKRMDSMMIESNIRKMGRLELICTCLSNLVRIIHNDGHDEILTGLEAYEDPDNRNRVVYYEKDIPQSERLQQVIDDASKLLPLCRDEYEHMQEYQLLLRVLDEQAKDGCSGKRIPKEKGEGMDSSVLQNPADPDATFRVKTNRQHRGYVSNITETVDEKGSVVTDSQYDVNTKRDASFIKESIENSENSEDKKVIIADGAYCGKDVQKAAAGKNITVLTTGLIGRKPKEILKQFVVSDDGRQIKSCPAGHEPKSSNYIKQTNSIRISFHCSQCQECLHQCECKPKIRKRVAVIIIPLTGRQKILDRAANLDDDIQATVGRIRNGVETVPSIIRNKYRVDKMPVRGKLRTKQFFGFKIAALNSPS